MDTSGINLDFTKNNGLIVAIAQDYITKEILMQAFINKESWEKTISTGEAVYFSRSRNKLWHKGETSGHVQKIKEILIDCDQDSVIFLVDQLNGIACHEGYKSCYYRKFVNNKLISNQDRVKNPEDIYK
jgi:phosphoribosyl-AMP cyclohydrolase